MNPIFAWMFQLLSTGFAFSTFCFVIFLYPESLLPFGVVLLILGLFFAYIGLLKDRPVWVTVSIVTLWAAFFGLLISQTFSESIQSALPVTLLQTVMILFSTEALIQSHRLAHQLKVRTPKIDLRMLFQQALRQLKSSSIVFIGSYVLALVFLYLGSWVLSAIPILADVSLYLVVVTVSLSLLLVFREE